MIPMSGRQLPPNRLEGFDPRYRARREADERPSVHAGASGPERFSLAERIEQALLEDERLHGD